MSFKTRRVLAYIFDIAAVSIIAGAISMSGLNPNIEKIEKLETEYSEKAKEYRESLSDIANTSGYEDEIAMRTEEFNEYYEDTLYETSKLSMFSNIITIVITVLYFVGFAYLFHGETVGKRLTKIKIVNKDGKGLSFIRLLIRTLVLYGLPIMIIDLICGQILSKNSFIVVYNLLYYVRFALEIAIILTILIRKDGRGLHDIVAGTKVIDVKEN